MILQPSSLTDLDGALEHVDLSDEAGHLARCGAVVDLGGRAHLRDPAAEHHDDPVGHAQRLRLVVRDVDGGDADAPLDVADEDAHLLAQLGVEIGERLVEQQDARLDHERARQRDTLLLAAGELARDSGPSLPASCTMSSTRAMRVLISAAAILRISSPKARFCATVMCGNSA